MSKEPIQSAVPESRLKPADLAKDILSRIERANVYARSRKRRFRTQSSVVKVVSLTMAATSTVILGLQNLNTWSSIGFSLVAVVTVVNTLEPFFAWRSRWVLMEDTQYKFYRLRDELTYYVASTRSDDLDETRLRDIFNQYQHIWDQLGNRWSEYRRSSGQA
jgi:hypothetical protein